MSLTRGLAQLEILKSGVRILASRDPNAVELHAKRDQLYIGDDSDKLTSEDRKKLRTLGFRPDSGTWYMVCAS